jgi:hypothetical protein
MNQKSKFSYNRRNNIILICLYVARLLVGAKIALSGFAARVTCLMF